MNVQSLNVTKADALRMLKEYREHRGQYDKMDLEIERICRQISRGKTVISVISAIQQAGLDDHKRPNLAIGRADAQRITCNFQTGKVEFYDGWHQRGKITVPWPGVEMRYKNAEAIVPRIPPQHRPTNSMLQKYWVLWEADWTDVPRDPYLLRRIGKDAWVVVAAWELTDLEVSVLRAHRQTI